MKKPTKCPECGSRRVAGILYGLPLLDEALRKELDEGTVALGGCLVEEGNPTWICLDCGNNDGRCPYFAYGSNMDSIQMSNRCPESRLIRNAALTGYRFIINSRGVASIVRDDTSSVHGVLWKTTAEDEANLDEYEGVKHGTYSKEFVRVKTDDAETLKALVYIAEDTIEGKPRNGYMRRILKAAASHGLPRPYIAELEKWPKE